MPWREVLPTAGLPGSDNGLMWHEERTGTGQTWYLKDSPWGTFPGEVWLLCSHCMSRACLSTALTLMQRWADVSEKFPLSWHDSEAGIPRSESEPWPFQGHCIDIRRAMRTHFSFSFCAQRLEHEAPMNVHADAIDLQEELGYRTDRVPGRTTVRSPESTSSHPWV